MKKKVLFVATFAAGMIVGGVIVGVISQLSVVCTSSTLAQTAPPSTLAQTESKCWEDTEEAVLTKMQRFQDRLDALGNPDSVEVLTKQTEAQQGIEDILTKYREAKNAKFAPFITGGVAGVIATIITQIGAAWLARRNSKSTRSDSG